MGERAMQPAAELEDFILLTEVEELRKALASTQLKLKRAKTKTEDLVEATFQGAREAMLALGLPSKVPAPRPDRRTRKAEVAVLLASDWHFGKETESFNTEVARARIERLAKKVERMTAIERADHPVREIHLLVNGDLVENLGIFPGQAWEVDSTTFEQMFAAVGALRDLIRSLLALFERVHVWTQSGNHGRIGRKGDNPRGDNVDRMVYRVARDQLDSEKRLTWHDSSSWYSVVEIGAYRALLLHGDQIKSFGGQCVTPDVRVLTRDLRWVPAGDLRVGDRLLAFDEHGAPRRYADAKITGTGIHKRSVWRVNFEDGSFVRCTPEHAWIVSRTDRARGGGRRQVWMTPPEIAKQLATSAAGIWMFQPVAAWEAPYNNYASGFLAGAFDADGCLSKGPAHPRWPIAEFSQYPNDLLAAVKGYLSEGGFTYKERTKTVRNGKRGDIHNLSLLNRDETLRFLGQVRPPRLLSWWMERIDVNALTFTRKSTSGFKRIVGCQPDGEADICALTSSSATYITEHGPAHNTPAFGILRKANAWASGVIGEPFTDVYMGHFHQALVLPLANGRGRVFVNPSVESDSGYAKEFVAATGTPGQRLHFVDGHKGGVTSERVLWLDE